MAGICWVTLSLGRALVGTSRTRLGRVGMPFYLRNGATLPEYGRLDQGRVGGWYYEAIGVVYIMQISSLLISVSAGRFQETYRKSDRTGLHVQREGRSQHVQLRSVAFVFFVCVSFKRKNEEAQHICA